MSTSLYQLIQARIAPPTRARPCSRRPPAGALLWRSRASLRPARQPPASQGVAPGDRVAVQVEKSPEVIFLYLACLRAGAVYLPLNTGYTLAELDYFFGDAEPARDRLRSGPGGRHRRAAERGRRRAC